MSFSKRPDGPYGPFGPLFIGPAVFFFSVVSCTCLEAHHSPQSNAKVKNEWIVCVFSSIFLNDLHMNNFAFYLNKYRHQSSIIVEAIIPQRTHVGTLCYCGKNLTFTILLRV
jgi:hypothetical protein